MSFQGYHFADNSWSTVRTSWSTHSGETCSQQKSSSSISSAADVDVHAAWDNNDLTLPVSRRRSDDRCSLLTHWTDSTASLKSCFSHNAVFRSFADFGSTAAESCSGANWHRSGSGRRKPAHHDRYRGRRHDSSSSSRRLVDSDMSTRPGKIHSRKCDCAESAVLQCHGGPRRRAVTQSSSLWGQSTVRLATRGRRTAARAEIRRAPMTVNNDDDDYITTSSEDDDQPATSTSSFAPSNCVDDRASLLSGSTTSSSAVLTMPPPCHRSMQQPAEPPPKGSGRQFFPSPRRRKSTGSFRSLTTSNDKDDENLERSRSSEEVAVASRYSSQRQEAVASQCREDEIRRVRSLFEFRSSDELRIANDFIDGVLSLCSRSSLYSERRVCPELVPLKSMPTSVFQLCYSCSDKDCRSDPDCDSDKVGANDDRGSQGSHDVTGNEQHSLRVAPSNGDVDDDNNSNRGLNVAVLVVQSDDIGAPKDWNGSDKEFCPVEIIAELNDVTATFSNEGDLKIYIRNSPMTFNDIPNNREGRGTEVPDAGHDMELANAASGKQKENAVVLDALSHRQNDTIALGEKSTLLPPGWLSDVLTEGADSNSRFATELIQVFDALLVRSGVGQAASVAADIKMFHPLIDGANDCTANERSDALKFLKMDIDDVATTLTKPTGDDFGSCESIDKSRKRADFNKNRWRKKRERASDIVLRLRPRLLVKPDLPCSLMATKSTEPLSREAAESNAQLALPKLPASYDNRTTATISTQTNNFNDDLQSIGESRNRTSRKSRSQGKVRELIKLFESASASTLDNFTSPTELKRAAISAAVSVGELLRCASEQEVTSCGQHARELLDVNTEQPRISSAKSTEALSSLDTVQAPRLSTEECRSKDEEAALVRKWTARWPTMSRFRRRHAQRHVYVTSAGDSATERIVIDRLPKTHNSRSDTRTTPVNEDNANLSQDDDSVRKNSKAAPLSNNERVKLAIKNPPECQNAPVIHAAHPVLWTGRSETPVNEDSANISYNDDSVRKTSKAAPLSNKERVKVATANHLPECQNAPNTVLWIGRPETSGCEVANVAGTSKSSSPVYVSGLSIVTDSAKSLSPAARHETVDGSPLWCSSSLQCPSKSLHTCEVAITPTTPIPLTGDSSNVHVDSGHQEGRLESSDSNKRPPTHWGDAVHLSTHHAIHGGSMLPKSVGLSREQSIASSENVTGAPSPEVATNDDCKRFDVQSWFTVGGPCLVKVPLWRLTSGNDVVAIVQRSKAREQRAARATLKTETSGPASYREARATLETETSCPASYREARATLETETSCPASYREARATLETETSGPASYREARATLETETSCPASYRVVRMTGVTVHPMNKVDVSNRDVDQGNATESVKYTDNSCSREGKRSYEVQTVNSSRTTVTKGDAASQQPGNETFDAVAITRTTELNQEFDVIASTGAACRGLNGMQTVAIKKDDDCLERGCTSVTSLPSNSQRNASDVTSDSDHRLRSVESDAQSDDPPSKWSSQGKESDTTSLTRTSSVVGKCGPVSREPIQTPGGVTVVYSRRHSTSDRPAAVTVTTPSAGAGRTPATDYRRLAQQFLLTSLLEYRLDAQRK